MIWVELALVLACILIGARVGGIGLGTVAGMGLMVLIFVFGLPPGVPPRTVLGMILCVITAAAAMQARREEQNNRMRNMGGLPGMSQPRPGGGGGGGARGAGGGGGQARP